MTNRENSLRLVYLVIDLILLNLAVFLAYWLNIGEVRQINTYSMKFYMLQANFSWIITYFAVSANNLYLRDSFKYRSLRISKQIALFTGVTMIISFLFMKGNVARTYMLGYILFFLALEFGSYFLIYSYMRMRRNHGLNTKRILLVGYNDNNVLLRSMMEHDPMMGYKFCGYVKYDARDINEIPEEDRPFILGNVSQLEQIIRENKIEVVFSAFNKWCKECN
jgi:FlaA1/EpsC-like NDP-sugar epimerase